jgi:hypothetical protein
VAQTQGLVQRLKLTDTLILAWAYIGPGPTDTELLIVRSATGQPPDTAAFRGALAEALSSALASRQQVIASHDDNGVEITLLQVLAP